MSSSATYLVGMVVLIGGLAYGAYLAGLATQRIAVGAAGHRHRHRGIQNPEQGSVRRSGSLSPGSRRYP